MFSKLIEILEKSTFLSYGEFYNKIIKDKDYSEFINFCNEFYGYSVPILSPTTKEEIEFQLNMIPLLSNGKEQFNILDLGCGLGGYISVLSQKFPSASSIGFDPASPISKFTKPLHPNDRFDFIFLQDCLYNQFAPIKLLEKKFTFLRPKGYFFIVNNYILTNKKSAKLYQKISNENFFKTFKVFEISDKNLISDLNKKKTLLETYQIPDFLRKNLLMEIENIYELVIKKELKREVRILINQ